MVLAIIAAFEVKKGDSGLVMSSAILVEDTTSNSRRRGWNSCLAEESNPMEPAEKPLDLCQLSELGLRNVAGA